MSGVPGHVYTRDVTISSEAEYKAARVQQANHRNYFLDSAIHTLALPNGNEIAAVDENTSSYLREIERGANSRYWFYFGEEPSYDSIKCFYKYGAGLPTPTPTPTPEPVEETTESSGGE